MLKVKTDITHEVVWNLLWSLERICLSLCLKPKESWNFEDNYSLEPKKCCFLKPGNAELVQNLPIELIDIYLLSWDE